MGDNIKALCLLGISRRKLQKYHFARRPSHEGGHGIRARIFQSPDAQCQGEGYGNVNIKAGCRGWWGCCFLPSVYLKKALELAKTIPEGGRLKHPTCRELMKWALPKKMKHSLHQLMKHMFHFSWEPSSWVLCTWGVWGNRPPRWFWQAAVPSSSKQKARWW